MNRSIALSAAFMGMLIFGICMISLGSVMPFLGEDLNLDEVAKGTLAALLPFGILLGSLIFGPVADRFSYRWLLSLSAVTAASGILIIGFTRVLPGLQLAFFMIGVGGGALNGATSALVSDLSTGGGRQKGANLSLLGVFYGIGALGVPGVLGLIPDSYGYQGIMRWIGAGVFLPALFFLLIQYPAAKQSSFSGFRTWKFLLQKKVLIMVSMLLFIQSGMESLINNWSTTYLIEGAGLETRSALFSLTLFVLIFTLTRVLLRFLLQKISLRYILWGALLMALLGGTFLHLTGGVGGAYLAVIFLAIGLASGFPVLLGIVGDAFPQWSGTAFSIVFTIAIIGNSLINYLVGWVTKLTGMGSYPVVLLSCMVLFGLILIPMLKSIK